MKRTELALGAAIALIGIIAAAALVSTAQAHPRSAVETSTASPASAVSAEQISAVGDPMPNGEFESIWGEESVAGAPLPETSASTAVETPVESADAAIAIALRDRASLQVATSTHAIRSTPEEAYGSDGLLAGVGAAPAPDSLTADGLWIVGVTGDIRNSYGAAAVPLDWMIYAIDARTGSVMSSWGNTGTLPDIFD